MLYIDIETYCDLDLRSTNAYVYSEHPSFEILMAAWAIDDGPIRVAFGDEIADIPGLLDPDVKKVAHNANFERVCFSRWLGIPGFIAPEQWHDTMAVAAENAYPMKLETLAKVLGGEQKDSAGTALINFFCKPYRGERRDPKNYPEKWERFVKYCPQDVAALRDVHKRLGPDFPTKMEQRIYHVDQRINDRGIRTDRLLVQRAIRAAKSNEIAHSRELMELTGIDNPRSNVQLANWFAENTNLDLPDLRADTVKEALQRPCTDVARRVLELRQELALVASKKNNAALLGMSDEDDRLRGQFQFFGAHTGRWAGRGVQLQNLPSRVKFKDEVEQAGALLDLIDLDLGADSETLKKLVRAMFLGPFTVVDYSSIEARVIAWLAGEEWALQAFRAGRDIYVETAERMSTPGNKLTRFQGKVAVLALGYNGGIRSLRNMGGEGTDEDLQYLVTQWRDTNQRIVSFWKKLDTAFRYGGSAGPHIRVEKRGKDRLVYLPSGRPITYHACGLRKKMTMYGEREEIFFRDWRKNGVRTGTYGGKLAENVTQAVARDVLAEALVRLDSRGYPIVAHVHDEVIIESDEIDEISSIMTVVPKWAKGLPIDGAGFTCERYRKD